MSDGSTDENGKTPSNVVLRIDNISSSPTKEQIENIISATSDTLRSILDPDRLETEGVKEWVTALGVKVKAKLHSAVTVDVEVSN